MKRRKRLILSWATENDEMNVELQGRQLNGLPGGGLAPVAVEKAKEVEAGARRASELANEAAIKARESAAKSARVTKELAKEAKRKAREAQTAALKARRGARLVAKMVKDAKKTEREGTNGRAELNGIAEQGQANSTEELISDSEERVRRESESVQKAEKEAKDTGNRVLTTATTGVAREGQSASSNLSEGTINILLQRPNAQQMYSLQKALRSSKNIRVVSVASSAEGCVKIVVFAEQPVPLIDVLDRIPGVDEAIQSGWEEIQVSLKKE